MGRIDDLLIDKVFYRGQRDHYISRLRSLEDPLRSYEAVLMKAICTHVSNDPDCFTSLENYALAKEESGLDLITNEFVKFIVITGTSTWSSSKWDELTSEIIHLVHWRRST